MSDFVPPSLKETWDWKKKAEDRTKGMSRDELINYYREAADSFEKALGITLPRKPRVTSKP